MWSLSSMNQHVLIKTADLSKFLPTNFAFKWPVSSVDQHVTIKTIRSCKSLLTYFAVETHVSSMTQFLAACYCLKSLFANFTHTLKICNMTANVYFTCKEINSVYFIYVFILTKEVADT